MHWSRVCYVPTDSTNQDEDLEAETSSCWKATWWINCRPSLINSLHFALLAAHTFGSQSLSSWESNSIIFISPAGLGSILESQTFIFVLTVAQYIALGIQAFVWMSFSAAVEKVKCVHACGSSQLRHVLIFALNHDAYVAIDQDNLVFHLSWAVTHFSSLSCLYDVTVCLLSATLRWLIID